MANEFKVKRGLIVVGSGSVTPIVDIQGSQGQLFSIIDSLSGSLFSVNDISGIPVIEAFSDTTVKMGQFNAEAIIVSGSQVKIGNRTSNNHSLTGSLITSGSIVITGSFTVFTGSVVEFQVLQSGVRIGGPVSDTHVVSGSLIVTGSTLSQNGSNVVLTNQTSSLTTFTSFNSYTSSINTYTSSLNSKTSSFATTGSNTFIENQTISGSLTVFTGSSIEFQVTNTGVKIGNIPSDNHTVTGSLLLSGSLTSTGTLTAQTLIVQTITSSVIYSSGSNVFGNSLSNTQVFTGSVNITGSTNIIGTTIISDSVGIKVPTPTFDLEISGSVRTTDGAFIANTGNTVVGSFILSKLGTNKWQTYLHPTNDNYILYSSVNAVERIILSQSGDLSINGNTNITGSLIASSSISHSLFGPVAINSSTVVGNYALHVQGNQFVSNRLGIGANTATSPLTIATEISGSTTAYGVSYEGNINSSVTTNAVVYRSFPIQTSGTFTGVTHYLASTNTFLGTVTNQYGFYADSSLNGATNDYGFYGNLASGSNQFNLYMNGTAPNYLAGALGVGIAPSATAGRIDASNDVVAFSTSDIRFKENINPIDNALEKLDQIGGYTFDWKTEEELVSLHGFKGHDVGVIAQEIEAILPEVVTTRDSGYKAVKYEKIVPLLIQAIKEQQEQIKELQDIIKNK
jgi:hypothetical protein